VYEKSVKERYGVVKYVLPGNLADKTPNPEAAARRFYSTMPLQKNIDIPAGITYYL
jgi:hypothetical protein